MPLGEGEDISLNMNIIILQVRRPMNASQAALVDKFASEPLEQSEMWVGYLKI